MNQPKPTHLRIFRRQSPVQVLGPHKRAVIWLQGCDWGCRGCIVPESWSKTAGELVSLEDLQAWILAQSEIEGITFSGGEPMLQADALTELVDRVRQERDLGVVCYTGYARQRLESQGTVAQQAFLSRIDLLIDGLYSENQHDNLLWRGSSNQGLHLLTGRYRTVLAEILQKGDVSAGLEFVSSTERELYFTGVPEQAGFREAFEGKLQSKGILLRA
ncbi:MAG: 4Fe-4S cluster-binding domain-containing protein [Snowella sp.]|nr:4Fe-4S cluster-binding domain-containing protein [Snowella sp.]